MTRIHLVIMFSLLWEDTWMSTHLPLRSKLGGIVGFPLPFRIHQISALRACTVPASWLMWRLALPRHWSVTVVRHRTVEMRPYAMAHAVSVRSLSSMQRRVSADPGDIGG